METGAVTDDMKYHLLKVQAFVSILDFESYCTCMLSFYTTIVSRLQERACVDYWGGVGGNGFLVGAVEPLRNTHKL